MWYLVCFLRIPHGWCHSRGIIMRTVNKPGSMEISAGTSKVETWDGNLLSDFKKVK